MTHASRGYITDRKHNFECFGAPLIWLYYKDVVRNENCREHKSCFSLCVCLDFNCLSCLICYIKCIKIPLFDLKHVKESVTLQVSLDVTQPPENHFPWVVFFLMLSYCQTEYAETTNKSLPLDITVHNYQKWVIAADLLSIKSCQ